MPCQTQHRWYLCLVFYLPVLSSPHSRELVSFNSSTSGHHQHLHFLIHWGDGDRGEEHWDRQTDEGASALGTGVGVKGVGVRSGGEEERMEQRD